MNNEEEIIASTEFNKGLRKTFEKLCQEQGWIFSETFFQDFQNFISNFDITAVEIFTNDIGLPTLRGKIIPKKDEPVDK